MALRGRHRGKTGALKNVEPVIAKLESEMVDQRVSKGIWSVAKFEDIDNSQDETSVDRLTIQDVFNRLGLYVTEARRFVAVQARSDIKSSQDLAKGGHLIQWFAGGVRL